VEVKRRLHERMMAKRADQRRPPVPFAAISARGVLGVRDLLRS
jgi:hypothetical protein